MGEAKSIWEDIQRIREQGPLVHSITNYVAANINANGLLALGASPAMTHSKDEMKEIVPIASCLVINIGTLTPEYVRALPEAWALADRAGVPVVLDPVAAGALPSRTRLLQDLLKEHKATFIRGNASEIMALAGQDAMAKGVDSLHGSDEAVEAAQSLATQNACAVCVSGEVDLVTDGAALFRIANGHPMMTRVTGMGCTATALCGAFCAVNDSPVRAGAHAMAVMGIAGEMAMDTAKGPGTLEAYFHDALYNMTQADVEQRLQWSAA